MDEDVNITEVRVKRLTQFLKRLLQDFDKYFVLKTSVMNNERFINDNELASILKLDKRTMKRYRQCGKLPYYKINGKILYKESEILEILESNYHPAYKQDKTS